MESADVLSDWYGAGQWIIRPTVSLHILGLNIQDGKTCNSDYSNVIQLKQFYARILVIVKKK